MAPPRSLGFNISWAFAGRLAYALLQWLITVALAWAGTAADVGLYGFAMAMVAPWFMLSSLQLRDLAATEHEGDTPFGHFIQLRVMTAALTLLLVLVIALTGRFDAETAFAIAAFGMARALENLSDIGYAAFQRAERLHHLGVSLILKSALALPIVTCTFMFTASLGLALLGMAAAWLAVMVTFDLWAIRRCLRGQSVWAAWNTGALLTLLRAAWPLGLSAFFVSVGTNIPRYFLEALGDREALGYYTAMATSLMVFAMLNMAVGRATIARLAIVYREGTLRLFHLLKRLVLLSATIAAAGLAGCVLFGEWFLTIAYGPRYADFTVVLVILMGARAGNLLVMHFKNTLVVFRRLKTAMVLHALALVTGAVVGCFAVPGAGLYGAAWTAVTVAWTTFIACFLVVRWLLRYRTRDGLRRDPSDGVILYIACDQRSGSTLLEQRLAAYPDMVTIGEARHVQTHFSENRSCGCGEPMKTCPFWTSLSHRMNDADFGSAPTCVPRGQRTSVHRPTAWELLLVVLGPRSWRALRALLPRIRTAATVIDRTWRIAAAARDETGTRIAIDGSKVADHAKILYLQYPDQFRMITLIRDGHGVVHSKRKRHPDLSIRQAARSWVLNNLRQRLMQWNIPLCRRFDVRYEELCQDPDATLRAIRRFMNLPDAALPSSPGLQHGVAGSPHRSNEAWPPIVEDCAWENDMSGEDLAEFESAAGRWLRRWGYKD